MNNAVWQSERCTERPARNGLKYSTLAELA
jgi:hypothetical protein